MLAMLLPRESWKPFNCRQVKGDSGGGDMQGGGCFFGDSIGWMGWGGMCQ